MTATAFALARWGHGHFDLTGWGWLALLVVLGAIVEAAS